jgi:hypothetical protein
MMTFHKTSLQGYAQKPSLLPSVSFQASPPLPSCHCWFDTPMTGTYKFSGTSFLQKELQGLVGFVAYQECHRKGESSTQAGLQAGTVSQYFGNPNDEDSIGLAEQLVIGAGLFSGLYNKEELVSTTSSPSTGAADATTSNVARHSTSASVVLVLKPEVRCLGADKRIIVGGSSGITLPLLFSGSRL